MRQITAKYDGKCRKCGKALPKGSTVLWEKGRGVFCTGCETASPASPPRRSYRRSRSYSARRSSNFECRCNGRKRLVRSIPGYSDSVTRIYECEACGGKHEEWDE
jgi:hypothetical protein